jgi:Zn-dependent protease
MNRGFPLGRLFGTDIYATGGYFVLLALYFYIYRGNPSQVAVWCGVVTVSLLVHEFGHVFAVRGLTGGECFVQLWMFGGMCVHAPVRSRGKQVAISLCGPVAGFVLAGVAWVVWDFAAPSHPLLRYFVRALLWVNLVWNGLNLLPIWPLDGGQALRAALAHRLGSARAVPIVRYLSIALALLVGILALRFGFTFGAAIALLLGMENLRGRGPTHD